MAYMNQQRKAELAKELKKVVPEGWKYSLAVRHLSTLVFTLRQAPVDIITHIRHTQDELGVPAHLDPYAGHCDVNEYHLETQFSGELLKTFQDIKAAMMVGNHDNSEPQTDYFDVGWYIDIRIGTWDDPFLDTVPAPAGVKKYRPVTCKTKINVDALAPYLPIDWMSMTPGKKAAATKKAMKLSEQYAT